MKDFTYYNPTRIEFGHGKENNIGEYIKGFGIEKVLLVFGSLSHALPMPMLVASVRDSFQ